MADLPSAGPPSEDEVNLRPLRLKTRLLIWLGISIGVHLVGGVALAASPQLRSFVFASFLNRVDSAGQGPSANQIRSSRYALDQITRKRIIECSKRMLGISADLEKLRASEWRAVTARAKANPYFKEMLDGGLPPLDLQREPGDPAMTVPALYDRACAIEAQTMGLYEQFKAVGMSLMTVSKTDSDAHAKPQSLAQSLELSKLERPLRPGLDPTLITMDVLTLSQGTNWNRYREHLTQASDLAEVMVNNCHRMMQVLEKIPVFSENGEQQQPLGSTRNKAWEEDNAYRGTALLPEDYVANDLASADLNAKVTLGKHLGDSVQGRDATWLAIDTWWCIGPFPYLSGTRDKASLRHAYPPEHGVDLDASYIGKDPTRPLRWQYRPMKQVRMEPRDIHTKAIWYFYSEFYSDQARDVYANIATDDYGSLWLNDGKEPVYTSGTDPRPWVILDVRQGCKLRLRKGTNRLLLKLDNNGGTTGFSVLIGLRQPADAVLKPVESAVTPK